MGRDDRPLLRGCKKTFGGVDDLSLDDPPCCGPGKKKKKNCWVGLYIFGLPIARKLSCALSHLELGTFAEQTRMTSLRRSYYKTKRKR